MTKFQIIISEDENEELNLMIVDFVSKQKTEFNNYELQRSIKEAGSIAWHLKKLIDFSKPIFRDK